MDNKNGSGFINFLDNLFVECSRARLEKKITEWYDLLCVLTLNLSTEMEFERLKRFRELKKSLLLEVNQVSVSNEEQGFNTIPIELEERLSDWEIDLRQIRKVSGLQQVIKKEEVRFT